MRGLRRAGNGDPGGTVTRGERGPVSRYCDACRLERQREQARLRVQAMRNRRGLA